MVARAVRDPGHVERSQLVHDLRSSRSPKQRARSGLVNSDPPVVSRAEIEPALELRDDRDQVITIRIAHSCQMPVVAVQGHHQLANDVRVTRGGDPLHRLGDHGGLNTSRRPGLPGDRQPAQWTFALQVMPAERRDALSIPEDDVRCEPIVSLPREQPSQLIGGPLRIRARPHDRMEARIPEPLKRVGPNRRHREAIGAPVSHRALRVCLEQRQRLVIKRVRHDIDRTRCGRRPLAEIGYVWRGRCSSRKSVISPSMRRPASSSGSLWSAPGRMTRRLGSFAASNTRTLFARGTILSRLTRDHESRDGDRTDPVDCGVAVGKHGRRDPGVVNSPEIGERGEGRAQHHRRRGCFGREPHGDARSERLAEEHDPVGIDARVAPQPDLCGARVCGQALLARLPRIAAVAPVVA